LDRQKGGRAMECAVGASFFPIAIGIAFFGPFLCLPARSRFGGDGSRKKRTKEMKKNKQKIRAFLDTIGIDGLSAFRATAIKIKGHKYKKYPGVDVTCKSSFYDSSYIQIRVILVKNDLFFILGVDKKQNKESVKRFLNSFRLK
jgi:hypothetical protein